MPGQSNWIGDLAIKNAAGSKYMAGGVFELGTSNPPGESSSGDGWIRFKRAANNL